MTSELYIVSNDLSKFNKIPNVIWSTLTELKNTQYNHLISIIPPYFTTKQKKELKMIGGKTIYTLSDVLSTVMNDKKLDFTRFDYQYFDDSKNFDLIEIINKLPKNSIVLFFTDESYVKLLKRKKKALRKDIKLIFI